MYVVLKAVRLYPALLNDQLRCVLSQPVCGLLHQTNYTVVPREGVVMSTECDHCPNNKSGVFRSNSKEKKRSEIYRAKKKKKKDEEEEEEEEVEEEEEGKFDGVVRAYADAGFLHVQPVLLHAAGEGSESLHQRTGAQRVATPPERTL
ncbi:hypothetical protein D9C73_022566 [Collichthys lucidus]|uniref:Uncharacterized protein n=1 Tax=Collichthys lucidus TaxID=240159 RepID=A0A4U5VKR3_COLLU|nr:hypothetical protein D9C73_022566 [Collichthys lucidus]